MNTKLSYLWQILLLSVLFFSTGWLGFKLIIPPGYSSPLWPSAGIALAVLLIGGVRYWPGIWLGAFAIQPLILASYSGELHANYFLTSGLIASGSCLQAVITCWLTQKYLGKGVPNLDSPRQILSFFILAGPVACLTAASIGVSSLWWQGFLPTNITLISWLNWWIGDSLGALLIAPLIFCFAAKPRNLWSPRRISVAIPMLLALLALSIVFALTYQTEKSRIQMEFDNQASSIDRLLVEYANHVIDTTEVFRDLYSASDDINRSEFAIFSKSILQRHAEIQAIEWLPRVTAEQLAGFEKAVQAEGYPDFKVKEADAHGHMQPVTPRAEYLPILFVEPMAENAKTFGLDSASQPISMASKQHALKTGKPSVTQSLTLAQRNDREPAILVSIPIFAKPSKQATGTSPELTGFISTVLLPARMIDLAMQGVLKQDMAIQLIDLSAPAGQNQLYSQTVEHPLNPNYTLQPWQHAFNFCDRHWQLSIIPEQNFVEDHGSALLLLTVLGGVFFSSIFNFLLLVNSGRTANVERLVAARTKALEVTEQTLRESETQLRTLIESQPECIKLLDKDGLLLDMNQAGLTLIGAENLQQVKGLSTLELVLPQYRELYQDSIDRVFAGESLNLEFEICDLRGQLCWMESHVVPMRDSEGQITALLGITRNITQRKRANDRLKLAARVFNEAHEGILITGPDANIIDVNPSFCDITGYSREEVIGKKPNFLKSGRQNPSFYGQMWQTLSVDRHWQGELWNRKKNGDLYVERLSISALCDEDEKTLYYVGLFSDITESKQQQQMLELMAHYDPLTRLPNRSLFADRLLQAIGHSRREKLILAVCLLDLDGFKPVNDQFGHEAGDLVLVEVAARIKNNLREDDTVSRYGGDEFALLITGLHSVEECTQTLTRIHLAIAQPYLIKNQAIYIGASSGISIFPLDDADADTLVRHADQAMYKAKLMGKNRYHVFDATQDQMVVDQHNQIRRLESAFAERQFCLYYQPKISLKTGQVTGVEALLRWQKSEQDVELPMTFLPVLASTELEIKLGNWVIEEAWQHLANWHQQGLQIGVSVNISAYHLLWEGFVDYLSNILAKQPQLESSFLQLEILESTALDDLSAVNRIINTCRDVLGVGAALDDFGTGYSSLTHLRHLPVDTVKIDRSFVRDMLDDPDDYAIVESVISLSQAFGNQVVAEGVETQEQGLALLLMHCYVAQGYAIAKPMPASEVEDWISHYQPNPLWQRYAEMELSDKQIQIALRRLDLQQWIFRVQQCLISNQNSISHWPIMQPHKSQFGRWLKQAQLQTEYDETWLIQLTTHYEQLLHQGDILMHQFWQGEVQTARAGFVELEALQQRLDTWLAVYA